MNTLNNIHSRHSSTFTSLHHLRGERLQARINDIIYVEGMAEYLRIHLAGQDKPIVVLLSMKKMEERLPSQDFMRIHKSYIISLHHIAEVNKSRVILDNEKDIPIGDSYRERMYGGMFPKNTLQLALVTGDVHLSLLDNHVVFEFQLSIKEKNFVAVVPRSCACHGTNTLGHGILRLLKIGFSCPKRYAFSKAHSQELLRCRLDYCLHHPLAAVVD